MKLKKVFFFLLALAFICNQAFGAVTYKAGTSERYTDDQGQSRKRVQGTIAMTSSYPCDTTTYRCGYDFNPSNVGLKSVSLMIIEPTFSNVVGASGGLIFFKYNSSCLSGTGATSNCIQAYYQGTPTGLLKGPLVSMPSYDLSALTAVPFWATGIE